jgi:hypothetical protein
MTEQQDNKWSTWGRAVGPHLGIVALSFVVSILMLPQIIPFDPEGAGAMAAVVGVLLGHGVAAVVSLLWPKISITSCGVVFCIAFFFTGCFLVEAIQRWRYLHYQAPYDRFRDYVASPIPAGVKNLEFMSLEEQISPDLMLRFDVAPEDLDNIISNLKMKRVELKSLPNPKDFFRYPYYLPLDGDDFEIYQGKDHNDEVLTLKMNKSHTRAIFRKESSGIYRDRRWENQPEIQVRMDEEALGRLKRQYEAAKGRK